MNLFQWVQIFKETGATFFQKDPMTYGASIAFYTLLSLPAITLLMTMLIGVAYESQGIHDALTTQLNKFLGGAGAQQIEQIMETTTEIKDSPWARVVGFGTVVFSATTVFISLQNALNNIWNLKAKPQSSIMKYILNRLISFGMVVSLGFLLLVSLVIDSVVLVIEKYVTAFLSDLGMVLISITNLSITLVLVSLIFALIFKFLPDAEIRWRQVRIGGIFTGILFVIGKFLIGLYLSHTDVGSAYGTAGSMVLFLTWVYYSTAILLFGATFTFVYSQHSKQLIRPSKHATFVEQIEVNKTI